MRRVDARDAIGGGLLIIAGIAIAVHSATAFQVGTLARMGPGFFPVATSIILAIIGSVILLPALFRSGPRPVVEWRPLLWISASLLAFALLVIPFGMVPATIVLTLITGRSDNKLSLPGTLLLAILLAVGATLIFRIGLGMILPAFNWPW